MNLSVPEKIAVIEDHEKGMTRAQLMDKYGLKKTTVHDILKAREKTRGIMRTIESTKDKNKIFRKRKLDKENLDDAVFKWYTQERAEGVPVRGVDIQHAAERLAGHLGHKDFKCSDGWLWRFRRRHGIVNRAVTGEVLSADVASVEPFVNQFLDLIDDEGLQEFQLYNGDETGLFWKSLPRNTQASKDLSSTPGRKIQKERISIMVCANADGSHRLKPVIVGKSAKPRALKDVMKKLPVEYHNNRSSWFTQEIVTEWFHKSFDPAVRQHQANYGVVPDEVKAVLLLDNAPAHPATTKLCSKDGRIKAMFLPPNTTSLIQPMDQGVIESTKRHYRNFYLQQCLVVMEDGMDEEGYDDTRGKKTLQNFKDYTIKDAIYNWAGAWKKVPVATLRNAWCKVLKKPKTPAQRHDFEGFEVPAAVNMLAEAGQGTIEEEEVEEWMGEDEGLPGYHHLTEEEIVKDLTSPPPEEEEEEERPLSPGPSISAALEAADTLLAVADRRGGTLAQNYELLRLIRLDLMRQVQQTKKQKMISDFFKPSPSPRHRSISETSSASGSSTSTLPSVPSVSGSSTSSLTLAQDIQYTPEPPESMFESDEEVD